MADKKIIAELEVSSGRSVQNLQAVTEALSQTDATGIRTANQLTNALQGVENATANVIRKEQENRTITERDGNALLQSYNRLQQAVRQLEQAHVELPPAVSEALTTARAQYDLATEKIRTTTTATRQQRDELQQGGVAWRGIGGAINDALGPAGRFQVQGLAVVAALREGIQIGTQFAQAIGTNFQAAEDAAGALKESVRGVTNALVTDGLWAAVQQGKAVLHTLDDSITGSGKAIKGYNDLVDAGVDRQKALALSTQDLVTVANSYALAQQGGTDALHLFKQVADQYDPKELAGKLAELTGKFQQLAEKNRDVVNAQKAVTEAHAAEVKAIGDAIDKIRQEIQAYKDRSDALDAAMHKFDTLQDVERKNLEIVGRQEGAVGGLTQSMAQLLEQITRQMPAWSQHRVEIENEAKGLADLLAANQTLSPEERKHADEIAALTGRLNELKPEEREHLQYLIDTAVQSFKAAGGHEAFQEKLSNQVPQQQAGESLLEYTQRLVRLKDEAAHAGESSERAGSKIEITGRSASNAGQNMRKAGEGAAAFGSALTDTAPTVEGYRNLLRDIAQHYLDIATNADRAIRKVKEFATIETSGPSAGDGGAISYPGVIEGEGSPGSAPEPNPTFGFGGG